ncbi:hypothetical protein TRFO_08846 [Tritrichomonas foetus]|uniref:Sugar phosphate transporter domain-containing protein n=1 Tax=Tritrichomonas foetus TaxID=1144522 RepID=A0A1J4JJN4_9EUKA|nr:hypothetical protein TRFO_08846 [Tritrichomonas foetus]|eukprot:OHS98559.1 hypothetical protein TRFO_08846 [Tritrichomonas foetus]
MVKSNEKLGVMLILMPIIGASVHIIQKFLFECVSVGSDNMPHKFHKPFFFTWLGSLGLFTSFLFNCLTNFSYYKKKFFNNKFKKPFLQIAISTFFNLMAGTLSNVTSLYLNYSVSLMLRSSTLIFGALINIFYLHRPLASYQISSVILTVIAIFFVGLAALLSGSKTTHREASKFWVGIIVIIRILSKSLQAISMIIEERVMSSTSTTAVELTGLSGIWSLFFSTLILIPSEDCSDTFSMLLNSKPIFALSLLSVLVFGVWTILSLQITKKASAVARMVFDQLTIVVVWVVQLFIHWFVVGTPNEEKYGRAGEAWTKWSWIQLLGFSLMVVGACVYQRIIRLPWFSYDELLTLD